jgi:hypothetical protein
MNIISKELKILKKKIRVTNNCFMQVLVHFRFTKDATKGSIRQKFAIRFANTYNKSVTNRIPQLEQMKTY